MKARILSSNEPPKLTYSQIKKEGWYEADGLKILFINDPFSVIHPVLVVHNDNTLMNVKDDHSWDKDYNRRFIHLPDFSIQI